jgi:polysaccharide pyruvyl transferase WcaK-like protein
MNRSSSRQNKIRICVLGNFSGRNAGDIAILGCLMQDVSAQYAHVQFVVPTISPGFLNKSFPQYDLEAVSLQPWALSLKIFGLPIFRAVLSSDIVLVTDNILFDMKLLNPVFNYLSTLSLVLPMAAGRGIPIVLYNMSLGPVTSRLGKWCFERVIRNSSQIILRDTQSLDLIDKLGIPHVPVTIGADCALNATPVSKERLQEIIQTEALFLNSVGTIGFNINAYLDAYIRRGQGFSTQLFTDIVAKVVDRLIEETGLDVLFVITQVMDQRITDKALDAIQHPEHVKVISNKTYSYEELTAVLSQVEVLVGMRTHALILASSVGTPVVGIVSYPKTAGYLNTIEQGSWTIKFADLNVDALFDLVYDAYTQRQQIRSSLLPAVKREKHKASASAMLLEPLLVGKEATALNYRQLDS